MSHVITNHCKKKVTGQMKDFAMLVQKSIKLKLFDAASMTTIMKSTNTENATDDEPLAPILELRLSVSESHACPPSLSSTGILMTRHQDVVRLD